MTTTTPSITNDRDEAKALKNQQREEQRQLQSKQRLAHGCSTFSIYVTPRADRTQLSVGSTSTSIFHDSPLDCIELIPSNGVAILPNVLAAPWKCNELDINQTNTTFFNDRSTLQRYGDQAYINIDVDELDALPDAVQLKVALTGVRLAADGSLGWFERRELDNFSAIKELLASLVTCDITCSVSKDAFINWGSSIAQLSRSDIQTAVAFEVDRLVKECDPSLSLVVANFDFYSSAGRIIS